MAGFCSGCGEAFSEDERFCAHCGTALTSDLAVVVAGEPGAGESDVGESSEGRSRWRKILVVAVVALVGIAAIIAVVMTVSRGSSGTSGLALVFEPGRDGYGDLYVVPLGQEVTREDRVLSDIRMTGSFVEAVAPGDWRRRDQYDFELSGGRVIAYSEEGDDGATVALVARPGEEPIVLADGDAGVRVYRLLDGGLVAMFRSDGRCVAYRILAVESVDRIGRADDCTAAASGSVLLVEEGSSQTQLTVSEPDGSEYEFSSGLVPEYTSVVISPGGVLVAAAELDPGSGEIRSVVVFDVQSESEIADVRFDDESRFGRFVATLDEVVLIDVGSGGTRELLSLSSTGDDVLASGDRVGAIPNPANTLGLIEETDCGDTDCDAEYSIWNIASDESVGSLQSTPTGYSGWLSDDVAVAVSGAGEVAGFDLLGEETDAGSLRADVQFGWITRYDGGIATLNTAAIFADGESVQRSLAIVTPGGEEVDVLFDEAESITVHEVSLDGRYLAFSVLEDAQDSDRVLYVFDVVEESLIDVDEDVRFSQVYFDGDVLIYGSQSSDDVDDVQTFRVSLADQGRPEALYDGALVYIARPSS